MLSISQLCENGNSIIFYKDQCIIYHKDENKLFIANTQGNLYKFDRDELSNQKVSYLMIEKEDHWLWHKKCDHASLRLISKL